MIEPNDRHDGVGNSHRGRAHLPFLLVLGVLSAVVVVILLVSGLTPSAIGILAGSVAGWFSLRKPLRSMSPEGLAPRNDGRSVWTTFVVISFIEMMYVALMIFISALISPVMVRLVLAFMASYITWLTALLPYTMVLRWRQATAEAN